MRKQSVGQPTGEQRVEVAWGSREKAIVPSVNDKPGVTHNSNEWVGNYFPNLVIAITTDQAVFPSEFLRRTTAQDRMGRLRRSRTHKAQRDTHRASRTRARTKDLDQIQLIDMDPKVSGPS